MGWGVIVSNASASLDALREFASGAGITNDVMPAPRSWPSAMLARSYETMNGPAAASTSSGVNVGLTASGKGDSPCSPLR